MSCATCPAPQIHRDAAALIAPATPCEPPAPHLRQARRPQSHRGHGPRAPTRTTGPRLPPGLTAAAVAQLRRPPRAGARRAAARSRRGGCRRPAVRARRARRASRPAGRRRRQPSDPLVGGVQAAGLDPRAVGHAGRRAGGRRASRCVRDDHSDEQPAPVGIAAGAANEVAVGGGDHLGGILELASRSSGRERRAASRASARQGQATADGHAGPPGLTPRGILAGPCGCVLRVRVVVSSRQAARVSRRT